MKMEKMYGVWSAVSKKFVFGISETSKKKAWQRLEHKIGKDSYKWRFEIKELKWGNPKAEEVLKQKVGK